MISVLRMEMSNLSYCGTRNVTIYAHCLGKFLYHGKYDCVKYLTNIMSTQLEEGIDHDGDDENDGEDDYSVNEDNGW